MTHRWLRSSILVVSEQLTMWTEEVGDVAGRAGIPAKSYDRPKDLTMQGKPGKRP
jgi:hypothetical protein